MMTAELKRVKLVRIVVRGFISDSRVEGEGGS